MVNIYKAHPKKHCILLIDDDSINREILKNIFDDQHTFEEAENGLEGLKKIRKFKEKLCAILLDVNMPVMNGIELLKILHEQEIPSQIPIFLITSQNEESTAREAYELGVMDVINKPVTSFVIQRRVQSVIELFQTRTALSAIVKDQADTIDELHKNTIEALASAIEFRDVESGEHTNRIYNITKYILTYTQMGEGFTESDIENIAIGSIMHDIGKIAISDVILNKPGKLTKEEFEIMKKHTVKGAMLLEQISKKQKHDSYVYACDIARHHHERWDGGGYPDGLKGDEISVWSQVASIADVYDALISPRVYKKEFTPNRAVEMIVNGECGVFNPKLIQCFLQAEPEIRKWYEEDVRRLEAERSGKGKSVQNNGDFAAPMQEKHSSRELVDVLLLSAAVQTAYDMIINVNLTKNTYYMMDYDRFLTHCAGYDGVFDDLIEAGAASIPESHRSLFVETFSRESLLRAYWEGNKSVQLEHPQYTDDGQLMWVSTHVLFVEDPRNGDICEITLARYYEHGKNVWEH